MLEGLLLVQGPDDPFSAQELLMDITVKNCSGVYTKGKTQVFFRMCTNSSLFSSLRLQAVEEFQSNSAFHTASYSL